MLITSFRPSQFGRFQADHPVAARQFEAVCNALSGSARRPAIWATMETGGHARLTALMRGDAAFIEVAIKPAVDGESADPFKLALEVCRLLEDDGPSRLTIHYRAKHISAAGVRIHWFTEDDEERCAEALAGLPLDATLEQVKEAFSLPYSRDDEWVQTDREADQETIRTWVVPGLDYLVSVRSDLDVILLKEPAGRWLYPSWLTLEEAAHLYGFQASSLRVAIRQGRLKSSKVGHLHRVRRAEMESAIEQGRLRPRDV